MLHGEVTAEATFQGGVAEVAIGRVPFLHFLGWVFFITDCRPSFSSGSFSLFSSSKATRRAQALDGVASLTPVSSNFSTSVQHQTEQGDLGREVLEELPGELSMSIM